MGHQPELNTDLLVATCCYMLKHLVFEIPDLFFKHVRLRQQRIPLRRFTVQHALNLSVLLLFLEAEFIRSSAIPFEVFRSFRADVVARDVGHRRSAVLLAELGPRFVFMISV